MLLSQYEQCWSDKRNYDQMIWQTPTISLGIVAILLSSLFRDFTCNTNWPIMIVIVTFSLAVALVGTVQLRKHRFFQMAIASDLLCIQGTLSALVGAVRGFEVRPIKFKASEIMDELTQYPDVSRCSLEKTSSYRWLCGLMYAVILGLLILDIILVLLGFKIICICNPNPQ